jgi:hypothetical protein
MQGKTKARKEKKRKNSCKENSTGRTKEIHQERKRKK